MRVLIDSCVAGSVAAALSAAGHEVESVAEWPLDPGDAAILTRAHDNAQVVLTLDRDFGEFEIAIPRYVDALTTPRKRHQRKRRPPDTPPAMLKSEILGS